MKNFVKYGLTVLVISTIVPHGATPSLPSFEEMIEILDLQDTISQEILDEVKQKSAERDSNPELFFANSLKVIEQIDPSLAGISDTWQNEIPADFLNHLITGLANYYDISEEERNISSSSINRLTASIPKKQTKFLSSKFESFSKSIVRHLEIVHGFVISSQHEEKKLLEEVKEELLENDSKSDVREIDQYLACLTEIEQREKEGMSKYLSKFIKLIEKYSLEVEELSGSAVDNSIKIELSVRKIFDSQSLSLADLTSEILIENDCSIILGEFLE